MSRCVMISGTIMKMKHMRDNDFPEEGRHGTYALNGRGIQLLTGDPITLFVETICSVFQMLTLMRLNSSHHQPRPI